MPSRTLATLSIVAAGVFASGATADAAGKKASSFPTVKKITPMTVSVGETMTISGTGFVKGKGKNTVVFRRAGKRTIFAKADGLSTKRLSVVVPEKLRSIFGKKNGRAVATRFQIRVLAKRFGKSFTPLAKSPVVRAGASVAPAGKAAPSPAAAPAPAPAPAARIDAPAPPAPANCDGDGQIDDVDADDDNDLLSDTLEATLKTNRCLADTDGDGMEDGWEYQSAFDLNQPSCPSAGGYPVACSAARPYPGKKPYPNPLFGDDRGYDHDGDWVTAAQEHLAWQRKGQRDSSKRTLTNMWYSAGKAASVDTSTTDGCVGMIETTGMLLFGDADYSLDRGSSKYGGNGCLQDDERDEDGDFLTNGEELGREMSDPEWWEKVYEEPPYRKAASPYEGTDWLDSDTDGDGVVDGIDDQDYDDFWNIEEIFRGSPSWYDNAPTGARTGLWVNPFNPCLPSVEADNCSAYIPLSGDVWFPFLPAAGSAPKHRWPLYGTSAGDFPTGNWNDDAGDPDLPLLSAQQLAIRPHDNIGGNDLAPVVEHPIPIPR